MPTAALDSCAQRIKTPSAQLALAIGISPASFERRRRRKILKKSESEVLYRIAYLLAMGAELFGSFPATWRWLQGLHLGSKGIPSLELLQNGNRRPRG